MTPTELITAYRAQLARVYGHYIAEATYLDYRRGWFYLSLAYWSRHANTLIRGAGGGSKAVPAPTIGSPTRRIAEPHPREEIPLSGRTLETIAVTTVSTR
jgi:hypothetical protein